MRSNIELLRIATGLTQVETAKRLGVSPSTFARVEAGQVNRTPAQTKALCALFGCSERMLFERATRRERAALSQRCAALLNRTVRPKTATK